MTKQVTINGAYYPVKFGFSALISFTDAAGLALEDLENLGDGMTLGTALTLVWAGLKDGARKEKQPFDLTVEDVADLIDDDQEAINNVLELFAKSFTGTQGK